MSQWSSECCPVFHRNGDPHAGHLARFEAAVKRALAAAWSGLTREVCGHLEVVQAIFEAPLRALIDGLVLECPECALGAAVLGHKLLLAAVEDVRQRCLRSN
jgi:hypothetical protein